MRTGADPSAKPTPRELKPLSDIDDQEGLRGQVASIHFYRGDVKMRNKNPASVIREALAKLLVFYYPFAGRLKEGPARKLLVDCSGEGVLFIEAEADVTFEKFGDALHPPFPCLDELLYDVPGSSGTIDSPLLLIQLLFARDPPHVTCTHHEYDEVEGKIIPPDDIIQKTFFFGSTEVSALRRFIAPHLKKCSTFEAIVASIWRCRSIALQPYPEEEMRMICLVNTSVGYYGKTFAYPIAISTAEDLYNKPLGHVVELLRKAKSSVTEEYVRSFVDLTVIKGRPLFSVVRSYYVSDGTCAGFDLVDFGWGKAAYAVPAEGAQVLEVFIYLLKTLRVSLEL
ncbi:hypothetical protein L1987_86093 [Smallanthus sonchifolius]|uniref:Uncharacterized protein n=1 Tax=Smallanthus sonchifolius TaxID=185202 RepID=A0ACB8XZ17_9ASTR|nr:hypothetical protein L1987_86093 [Smallanthus sonchifolius]